MGDVVPFKKPSAQTRNKGKSLCRNGFHKWELLPERPFDVHLGKLVTAWRCVRCGARKTEAR